MKAKKWTELHDAALEALYRKGKTDEQIGKLMSRTENSVRERRSKIGAVKYTKGKYTQKNPSKSIKRGSVKLTAGTQIPLLNLDKALNQPEPKNGSIIQKTEATGKPHFQQDYGYSPFDPYPGSGTIIIDIGCGVSIQGNGLTKEQAIRVMLKAVERLL